MSAPSPLRSYPYVPTTVSLEAQSLLRDTIPFGAIPNPNQEVFIAIRQAFAEFTKAETDKAIAAHVQKITKIKLDDVEVVVVNPKNAIGPEENGILIYIHGGAYTVGSADHLFQVFADIADQAKLKTYAINYRLAPEFPFPTGLTDCLKVYQALLKTHHQARIFLLGDSAGGALVLAMLLKARDEEHLPMPAAIGLFSPMTEAEQKGDTMVTHEGICPVLTYASLKSSLDVYVPEGTELNHPYISPINGSFISFPPTMIVSGTRDLFLSSCVRLENQMSDEGIHVRLKVFEGMGHGFTERYDLPEAQKARQQMARFFLSMISSDRSQGTNDSQSMVVEATTSFAATAATNDDYAQYQAYWQAHYIDEDGYPMYSGLGMTYEVWKEKINK